MSKQHKISQAVSSDLLNANSAKKVQKKRTVINMLNKLLPVYVLKTKTFHDKN